jgi:hypothetical protein
LKNKIIVITAFLAVIVGMTGMAMADPLTPTLMQGSPNQGLVAPQPVPIGNNVGDTAVLSLKLEKMYNPMDTFTVSCQVTPLFGAPAGGITATTCISPLSPGGLDPYTAVNSIVLTNNGAPANSKYSLVVSVNGVINTFDVGVESRVITPIPEFPTVALPIAGVIGLVFFFQQRKNENKEE